MVYFTYSFLVLSFLSLEFASHVSLVCCLLHVSFSGSIHTQKSSISSLPSIYALFYPVIREA